MNNKITELKEEQKTLAKRIRQQKTNTKDSQRKGAKPWAQQALQLKMRSEYRNKHIAYCLLRGRTIEQIEPTTRKGNEPNMPAIKRLMSKYYEPKVVEETKEGV
tara:strand:+ start:8851 stop:9162 length:312 start_codon:yes stop_codon:yes gene_type:complete